MSENSDKCPLQFFRVQCDILDLSDRKYKNPKTFNLHYFQTEANPQM